MIPLSDPRNDNLVAQVLAHVVDLLDQRIQVLGITLLAVRPPLLQFGTLTQLVLEDGVRLVQVVAQIRNADIEQSAVRHARQKVAAVTRLRKLNLRNQMLHVGQLRHEPDVLFAIGTPRKGLIERLRSEIVAGSHLFARMQQRMHAGVRHVDRSL